MAPLDEVQKLIEHLDDPNLTEARWRELVDYKLLLDVGDDASGVLRREVEEVALAAWRCLGCRDAGRVDVRLDGSGHAQLIEVNPLAGLTPGHSDLPIMAALKGMDFATLIGEILRCATDRIAAAA